MRFFAAGFLAAALLLAAWSLSLGRLQPASALASAAAPPGSEAKGGEPEPYLLPKDSGSSPLEPGVPAASKERKTLKGFLQTALMPVGETMYIYGGGWNEEDTGAGIEAMSLGVSPRWAEFAAAQDETYDHKNHRYEIHNGLDCTGFIGWAVFNLFPGSAGYVFKSGEAARSLADCGLGSFTERAQVSSRQAGDIMSTDGHAWISLGEASDKSVVILHSTPPGVALWGTQTGSVKSEAARLAEERMAERFPAWHAKYPQTAKTSDSYLSSYDQFRWDPEILPDPDGYREMGAEALLMDLFSSMEPNRAN